jgi:hypothetical protein
MIPAIIAITILLIVLLFAVKIGLDKGKQADELTPSILHSSGIYSITRKSPRENIGNFKPSHEEILKYFSVKNVNSTDKSAMNETVAGLLKEWDAQLEYNIREIEDGDAHGVHFYYYDYSKSDPVCDKYITEGRFVTREEIYRYPVLIPPFHLGCGCILKQFKNKDTTRDTILQTMLPLFNDDALPPLPGWQDFINV